jgi:transposase InsO family protein
MAVSTVSGTLTRQGLGRLGRLGLKRPLRYERSRPGELVHIDVKRLGRIDGGAGKRAFGGERRLRYNPARTDREGKRRRHVGYEYVQVCVDDYSRLAYAEVLPDEKTTTAIGFLERAVSFYRRRGIRVERLLTDNGSAYVSVLHALACRRLGIRHSRTRPYRPQTNGKAERFIRTLLAGWAYRAIDRSSRERAAALDASRTTTIGGDTQPLATNPRSAEPTCSGLTPRRRRPPAPARGCRSSSKRPGCRRSPRADRSCGAPSSPTTRPRPRPSSSGPSSAPPNRR